MRNRGKGLLIVRCYCRWPLWLSVQEESQHWFDCNVLRTSHVASLHATGLATVRPQHIRGLKMVTCCRPDTCCLVLVPLLSATLVQASYSCAAGGLSPIAKGSCSYVAATAAPIRRTLP